MRYLILGAAALALSGCSTLTSAGDDWLQSADPDAKIDGKISEADLNAMLLKADAALELYGGFGALPATAQSTILLACALSDALSTSLDAEARAVCDAVTGRG